MKFCVPSQSIFVTWPIQLHFSRVVSINALSPFNEDLQYLTTSMQRCLVEVLLLHPAVHKCQAVCFHPRGKYMAPDLHWDSHPIAKATFVRFLGLHLEPGLSWTAHIDKTLQNGRNALCKLRHILRKPRHNEGVKLVIIKNRTYRVPAMRWGMKVRYPPTPEEKRGVLRLHVILVDALIEALGILRSHPVCC
jgi:hypothetical protein